jgi:hypothetical protein
MAAPSVRLMQREAAPLGEAGGGAVRFRIRAVDYQASGHARLRRQGREDALNTPSLLQRTKRL